MNLYETKYLRGAAVLYKIFVFARFDPRLNSKEAERKFMWKSITPYISFFIVLLITVAVFPLCEKHWIPCSELSLVALFFTGNFGSNFLFCKTSAVGTG